MTVHGSGAAQVGWLRRHRWTLLLATVVLIAAVVAAALYRHWRHSANEFEYYGNRESGPVRVGKPMYASAELQPRHAHSGHRVIDLHTIRPRVVENTAAARIDILTCRVKDPNLGLGMSLDTGPCGRVGAFRPGRADLGFPAVEIVYKITATRPGRLHIAGTDVTYTCAGRDGDQHAGIDLVVRAAR